MFNWVPLVKDNWRYPQFRDFISMGLGIEARHRRCQKYWAPHLNLCKQFQMRSLEDFDGGQAAAVLGAGRLLDIDNNLVARKFCTIDLYDADPAILRSKQKIAGLAGRRADIKCYIEDLTGCMSDWTGKLNSLLTRGRHDKDALIKFFQDLNTGPGQMLHQAYQVIFSVNLLSQVCIYWRDRVHECLSKAWGLEADDQGNYEAPVQIALEGSMAKLQIQHLELLNATRADRIVLITDRYFHYYVHEQANWMTEPALWLNNQDISVLMPDYRVYDSSSWFWHIAPQDVEQKEYGSIHEVIATAFRKI
jgi:hypothetical protein